jgi:hypothetical protein
MKIVPTITKIGLVSIIVVSLVLQVFSTANAADARNFNAGRIIDDGIFANSNSMTVANIQSFFNSKTVCDTWGQKQSELGGGTRAQWLAAHGIPTPITCLRDYYENPSTSANNYGKAIPPGGISAAQIIYNYSQQFSINPQVLIATLQKENGLITDEWPTPKQYSESMGFGCPDNVAPGAPACDPNYGSFSAQIYQAARHFRGFMNNTPGWFIPFTTGNNTIRWSPTAACGSSTVNIQNRATVALYSYTPYQPNQAALNAQYGSGDGCSAYGNRNFYLYFTDWFGSTFGGDPVSSTVRLTSPISLNPANPIGGQTVTATYTVKNFGGSAVNYENSILQCRYNSTGNCDSGYGGAVSIAAGDSKTITNSFTVPRGGSYTLVPYFLNGGIWYRYGVESSLQNVKSFTVPDIQLASAITTSPAQPIPGQPMTVSYTVANTGAQTVTLDNTVLQCRFEGANCDSAYTGAIAIGPGAQRVISHTITPQSDGTYALTPYFSNNGVWYAYTTAYPSIELELLDVRLTGDITTSPTQPVPGQGMDVSYTVKNFGTKAVDINSTLLQCRFNTTTNCDPSAGSGDTLDPGESKTLTATIPPTQAGSYRLMPYFTHNGKWYEFSKGTASANLKNIEVPRYVADMRLVGDITTTPADPIPGESVSVSYKVKNFGTFPAIYQDSVLQCRYNTNTNCDTGYTGALTIEPGAEQTFTYTITNSALSGVYDVGPYYAQNNTWYKYGNGTAAANTKRVTAQAYVPDIRLTSDITTSPTQPAPGQAVTVNYTVKNFGTRTVTYGSSVLQCRLNTTTNCDPAWDTGDTLDPGESKVFSVTLSPVQTGSYRLLPYFSYNGNWYEFSKGTASSNVKQMSIH